MSITNTVPAEKLTCTAFTASAASICCVSGSKGSAVHRGLLFVVVIGDVNLFEFAFSLHSFHALLLNIAVSGLPHVVVLDNVAQTFPGQLKNAKQTVSVT